MEGQFKASVDINRYLQGSWLLCQVCHWKFLSGTVTPSRLGLLAGLTLSGMSTFPCPVKGASNPVGGQYRLSSPRLGKGSWGLAIYL